MIRLVHRATLLAPLLLLLLSAHTIRLCSGAATWSVNVASGFTSSDYSTLVSTVNNAADGSWMVQPPGAPSPQPARITSVGGNNWPGSAWLANGPLSAWISVSANDYNLGKGTYNFTREFMVPAAVQVSTVMFTGSISCDNDCNMLFNGARIGSYWSSTYANLVPFSINIGNTIRVGQVNQLRINLTDYGSQNAVRIQGTISGTLSNHWSVNVATGWTNTAYTGTVSSTNAASDANWAVRRAGSTQTAQAQICTSSGGNWPTPSTWTPNGPLSTWIAVGCTSWQQGTGGSIYTYTFMLPANLDPYSITFVGAITCDDDCDVRINNNPVGPHYTMAYTDMYYFSYDWSAGWVVGGTNTITMNLTDTGVFNGIRMQGTIQGRTRLSSSTGRAVPARRCPYWAVGSSYPRCSCPYEGTFPNCECPSGRGEIPYDCYAQFPDPDDPTTWTSTAGGGAGSSESSSGLSGGVIVLIVMGLAVAAAGAGYLYWRHTKNVAAVNAGQQDKSNLLANQGNTSHLGAPANNTSHTQPAPQQGGLDYYMSAPSN